MKALITRLSAIVFL